MSKKAKESTLLIGELLIPLLKPTFGETNMAITMNRARITIEAPKNLFTLVYQSNKYL
jgi:hypothetical protein